MRFNGDPTSVPNVTAAEAPPEGGFMPAPIDSDDLAAQVRYWKSVKAGTANAAGKTQAQHNAAMAKAREAQHLARVRQIDPDGTLAASDPDELARRVDLLRRAQLADMLYKSVKARAERRQQRQGNAA